MKQNRREFLIKSGCALSMTAMATQMRHFGLMSAMAQEADDATKDSAVPSDYRALVCVFLSGGNDGNNTVIPNHNDATISNYTAYFNARNTQGLAIAQASLLPITVPRMGNLNYGLHPGLGPQPAGTNIVNNGIHELWGLGKMAVVTNVGTLVAPMTKTQYQNGSVPKPFQLFSHSDQVSQYQGGRSDLESFTGWGGRISDLRTSPDNPGALIPMITSISGAQLFTAGQTTLPLAIANAGTGLNAVLNPAGFNTTAASQARLAAFNSLRGIDLSSQVVAAASHVTDQAMAANAALQTFQEVTVTFPNTNIGLQLKQVARMIKKRTDLSVNRQVFFVQLGGFDTHNGQINQQNTLFIQLSQAMRAFYEEMVSQGLGDKVTQFTMADFSRTFNPASSGAIVGSDHAWANHHFVVGGGITASDFYGINTTNGTPYPSLVFNGPDDADSGTGARGRWIPTTSVEQYAATLARWYGLPDANLAAVFPKITNFANTNLGFMQPPAP
ncbi:MAG TPA: DUF1501 domain-containing protein [Pyrinomonadaceae bacterium]|nr:DUF1501 domain-containing protein [Pyrinomonadaceae bacterium]